MFEFAASAVQVEGLFLGFGACFGNSITVIANCTEAIVHELDSIQGLPESRDIGDTFSHATIEGKGAYSTG